MGARASSCLPSSPIASILLAQHQQLVPMAVHQQSTDSCFRTHSGGKYPLPENKVVETASTENAVALERQPEDEVNECAYEEAVARCEELRRTRENLLLTKKEVAATIAQFAPAFAPTESDSSEDDDIEEVKDVRQHCEEEDVKPRSILNYEDALAFEEELAQEVEYLQERMASAASWIRAIAQKSKQWGDHLEEVESQVQPSNQIPAHNIANASTDTSSDGAASAAAQVSGDNLLFAMQGKQDNLKLPSLHILTDSGKTKSEASSSTATPRSEKSAESRMVSARSDAGTGWCEAY
jgi:hypothetical protein